MATLSPVRENVKVLDGLNLLSRGKVRDLYELPDRNVLLSLTTDAISIFDFVLNAKIPMKGIILNALNHFWCAHLGQFGIENHLASVGENIDRWLPLNLRGNADLQSRASVIHKMEMAPVESIYRSVLTGSSVSAYRRSGSVCGHPIPQGLQDGDSLPCILDTPTTKAEGGHDENMPFAEVRRLYPQQTMLGFQIFQIGAAYAESRGIKLADTKFEFGKTGTIGDEILTPDSSRFWELRAWQESRGLETRKAPPPYDKQFVREWGIKQGIQDRDPKNPEDVSWVHSLELPENVVRQTTRIYRYIFWRLTGYTIERYLREVMGVAVSQDNPSIRILCEDNSCLFSIKGVISEISRTEARISLSIASCYRNPFEIVRFAKNCGADVVICVGNALPGVVDALLYSTGKDIPVIGVAFGEEGSKALEAAQLAIQEIPGSPVIMDETKGVYTRTAGLRSAIHRVINGELPPPKPRTEQTADWDISKNY